MTASKRLNPLEILGLLNLSGIPLRWIAEEYGVHVSDVRSKIHVLQSRGFDLQMFRSGRGWEAKILPDGQRLAEVAAEAYYERTYGR